MVWHGTAWNRKERAWYGMVMVWRSMVSVARDGVLVSAKISNNVRTCSVSAEEMITIKGFSRCSECGFIFADAYGAVRISVL